MWFMELWRSEKKKVSVHILSDKTSYMQTLREIFFEPSEWMRFEKNLTNWTQFHHILGWLVLLLVVCCQNLQAFSSHKKLTTFTMSIREHKMAPYLCLSDLWYCTVEESPPLLIQWKRTVSVLYVVNIISRCSNCQAFIVKDRQ